MSRGTRASVAGAMMIAALLGVMAFAPAVDNQFVYDDIPIIVNNKLVTQPGPWYRFWVEPYWPREVFGDTLYRPLTVWSFRANIVLWGDEVPDPRAFHMVNLALHGLASAGVALLAWRLTRRGWAAWLAGALFATHPLHTEAVVTAYGRSELLAGLLAVWLMARYVRRGGATDLGGQASGFGGRTSGLEGQASGFGGRASCPPDSREGIPAQGGCEKGFSHQLNASFQPGSEISNLQSQMWGPQTESCRRRSGSLWFHGGNALLLLLAVMSKEHALFMWPVLGLYDLWASRQRYRGVTAKDRPGLRAWLNRVAPAHIGFILAVTTFMLLRFNVFGQFYRLGNEHVRIWESPVAHATPVEHVLVPFRLLWLTLKLTVWPAELCPIWGIPALSLPGQLAPDVVAGMALLVGLVGLAVLLWRRGSVMVVVLAGLLILLVIPTHALPVAHWLFAERWLYLPSALMAVLVAAGLSRVPVVGWAVGLTAAIVLLPASWQYGPRFADNLTMSRTVVERQPDNFQGRRNVAYALLAEERYPEAIEAAQEVIRRFEPPVSDPYYVLIKSYLALGRGREALEALDTYAYIRRFLPGLSLTAERKQAEALIAQEAAAQSQPAPVEPAQSQPAT